MISCKKATYLVSKQEENRLSLRERIQLRIHMNVCNLCRRFKSQTEWISRQMNVLPEQKEHSLSDERKQLIKKALEEES